MAVYNKLELLCLANLSSLVYCLWGMPELTQVKPFSDAPLRSRLLALPTNIRLGWEVLPRTML
jgi:hypothetical protein